MTSALNALVGYIPTEIITLYVAALSAEAALHAAFSAIDAAAILWFFEARWRVAEGGEGDDE